MKSKFLPIVVLLLAVGNFAQAQDLHGSVDMTYQSKYLWRGFDIYGDKSAFQPSLDLDLFGSGLGVSVMGHRANSDGYENAERWDYTFYYQNITCPNEAYALMYRFGWTYYNYPQMRNQEADLQEAHAVLSLPKMFPAGLAPSYTIAKLWPNSSHSLVGAPNSDGTASGWLHIFRLDYPLIAGSILPDTPQQIFNLSAEAVYNDGFGPNGQNVDHDWSSAVFGLSTGIILAEGLVLTPGVYHQVTMEKTVNEEKDETWVNLSLTGNF